MNLDQVRSSSPHHAIVYQVPTYPTSEATLHVIVRAVRASPTSEATLLFCRKRKLIHEKHIPQSLHRVTPLPPLPMPSPKSPIPMECLYSFGWDPPGGSGLGMLVGLSLDAQRNFGGCSLDFPELSMDIHKMPAGFSLYFQ